MPSRIQRKRTKGWKMPAGTIYVGRPTKLGNPYVAETDRERILAVAMFRGYIKSAIERGALDVRELRGKDLACWCPSGASCHADVLLELANCGDPAEVIRKWI